MNFHYFVDVIPNRSKIETSGINDLKVSRLALFDMNSIDLNNESIKILVILYSYNKKIIQKKD